MVGAKQKAERPDVVWVLAAKYFMDVAKSPGLIACCAFPVLFLVMLRFFIVDTPEGGNLNMFILTMGMLFSTGMVPGTATVYPMAEAREKHALRTLTLAGVGRWAMIAARGIVSVCYTLLVAAGCFFASGVSANLLAPFMLAMLPASVTLTAFALLFGLASRNQMAASFFSLPVVLIGIAPMLCLYSEAMFQALPLLPSGGGFAFVFATSSGMPLESFLVPSIVAQLAWAAVALIALVAIAPRIPRDEL